MSLSLLKTILVRSHKKLENLKFKMDKWLFIFFLVIVCFQEVWTINFCKSEDFQQTIPLTNPACNEHRITIPNKRCSGACMFNYKPTHGELEATCSMCKPTLSEVKFTMFCGSAQEEVKFMVVSACQCESVDCGCI